MISAVFSDDNFETELETYIAQILKHAPLAQGLLKGLIYEGLDLTLEEAITLEANRTAQLMDTADAREGIAAFVEKRKPKFTGK
jgi:enoyl-CoA hydratase/carnithine racemase